MTLRIMVEYTCDNCGSKHQGIGIGRHLPETGLPEAWALVTYSLDSREAKHRCPECVHLLVDELRRQKAEELVAKLTEVKLEPKPKTPRSRRAR